MTTKNKKTGPGKVTKLEDGSTLLFNYDIDSEVLKPEHSAELERTVITVAKANPEGLKVVLTGSADRLGAAGHNVNLSNRRVEAIKNHLRRRMPNYNWDFDLARGVGESNAERAGDADDTPDEIFRSVMVDVLKPGEPTRPKPRLPNNRPKKPGEVPRVVPPRPTDTCVPDAECPAAQDFAIQLLFGATGGEVFEGASFHFFIEDTKNRLRTFYIFRGIGVGTPSPIPINLSLAGKPTAFHTSKPTKVTRFGPHAAMFAVTLTAPPLPLVVKSRTDMTLQFRSVASPNLLNVFQRVHVADIDTGPITIPIPNAGTHGGLFTALPLCNGGLGASRF